MASRALAWFRRDLRLGDNPVWADWRRGERWFRRMLIDGDMAQNAGNWQWVAGTGLDAAPFFWVFNPVAQSRRHGPEGFN